jgi:hypothetical protein
VVKVFGFYLISLPIENTDPSVARKRLIECKRGGLFPHFFNPNKLMGKWEHKKPINAFDDLANTIFSQGKGKVSTDTNKTYYFLLKLLT